MKANDSSIKRRRLLLLFWGSILLSSVLIIGETFSASTTYVTTETSETMQEGTYMGPDFCGACHTDQKTAWEGSMHQLAWNASTHITPDSECYTCHVNGTNYETGKFIGEDLYGFTATNDPLVDGVSCETCHGPFQAPGAPGHMPVTLAAELCGECHSPFHSNHGSHYERWSKSGHAHANVTLIESGAEVPRCIHCMSAEGAVWGVNTFAEIENGITCAVCHDPHTVEHENHGLRETTVFDTCVSCHSHETDTGPHLQRQVYDWEEEEFEDVTCATCHMYGVDYSSRTESWDKNTNHTMSATLASCGQENLNTNETGCHTDPEAAWAAKDTLIEQYKEKLAEVNESVVQAEDVFETANTTAGVDPDKLAKAMEHFEALDEVWGNIGQSATLAFHDPLHLEEMLDEANLEAQEVIRYSEEALEPPTTTTVSETGLQLLAVLGLGITLLVAVLRRRRVA